VASRIAMELILEVRYMLWSLGVALDGPELKLGDSMTVVLNTTIPSSFLKKKHVEMSSIFRTYPEAYNDKKHST
jgi:hypothetical protein